MELPRMNTRFCATCGAINSNSVSACHKCGAGLPTVAGAVPVKQTTAPANLPSVVTVQRKTTPADVLSAILWLLFCAFLILVLLDYIGGSQLDTGAPQQAARAAMSCFYVIIGYCGMRGITEVLRLFFGG